MDDFQSQFDKAIDEYASKNQYTVSKVPFHTHNGTDSSQVDPKNLLGFTVLSSVPTYTGHQGEMVFVDGGSPSLRQICVYENNNWRCVVIGTAPSGIAFDNSVQDVRGNGESTSFVNAGNLLFVGTKTEGGGGTTSITYNGVAMSLIDSITDADSACVTSLFCLKSPALGTHNITVTTTAGSVILVAASYTNCSQVSQPDASSTNGPSTTTTYSQSVTSTVNNCWAVLVFYYHTAGNVSGSNPTAGSNTVIRQESNSKFGIADTANPKTPAGTITLNLLSSSQIFNGVMASFGPS